MTSSDLALQYFTVSPEDVKEVVPRLVREAEEQILADTGWMRSLTRFTVTLQTRLVSNFIVVDVRVQGFPWEEKS